MTPFERTRRVLMDLDSMLEDISTARDAPYTAHKAISTIHWIAKNLNRDEVLRLLPKFDLPHAETIADLLKKPEFTLH